MGERIPSSSDSADVLKRLDELQGEVANLRDRIERARVGPEDRRCPDRHRTQSPYLLGPPDSEPHR